MDAKFTLKNPSELLSFHWHTGNKPHLLGSKAQALLDELLIE